MKKKLLYYKFSVVMVLLFMGLYSYAQSNLIISKVADPKDNYNGRFVQLFNPTSSDIDLSAGSWYLVKQSNGGSSYDIELTGTIQAGSVFVIAGYSDFSTLYGFDADMTSGQINGNGNDGYFLYQGGGHGSGTLIDAYGVVDEDGSGKPWDYKDGLAERNRNISAPNATWTASEWTITRPANVADMDPANHVFGSDTQAPSWSAGYPMPFHVEDTRANLVVKMDESGTAYYVVVSGGSDAPTADQVKAGVDYGSVTVGLSGSIEVTSPEVPFSANLTGAAANTTYDIYVVAEDEAGNLQTTPAKVTITTTEARSLTITSPAANTVFNLGETVTLNWTSANLDSLLFAVRNYANGAIIFPTEEVIDASAGTLQFTIPHTAEIGNYDFLLLDLYDTSFKAVQGPIQLVDNRQLTWVKPQNGDTVYVGDTLRMIWTSQNIDSVLIGGYIGQGGPGDHYFMITGDLDHYDTSTFRPIPASSGEFNMYLDPNNMSGSLTIDSLFIFDASDMRFKDVAHPVYILDTLPMRITYSMPSFGMTDFMPNANIDCSFSCDSIVKGTGNLYVKDQDDKVVYQISADRLQMYIYGAGFSFTLPPNVLKQGKTYSIEIDSGFVSCADGSQTFPGISGDTWTFTVASSSLYFSEYIEGSSNNKPSKFIIRATIRLIWMTI